MCRAEDARELSAPPQAVFPGSSWSLRDFRWITPHERWDREGTSQERSKAPALETSINFAILGTQDSTQIIRPFDRIG